MIIHFNGLPGVGKLTVARAVFKLLREQGLPVVLVDNQILHNIPLSLCPRDTDEYWTLFRQIRDLAYTRLYELPLDTVIIMTNALVAGIPSNDEQIERLQNLAVTRGDAFYAFLLQCDLKENQRRVQQPDRLMNRKLTHPDTLAQYHASLKLWHPKDGTAFETTRATPDYVARKVVEIVFPTATPLSLKETS